MSIGLPILSLINNQLVFKNKQKYKVIKKGREIENGDKEENIKVTHKFQGLSDPAMRCTLTNLQEEGRQMESRG